MRGITRRPIGMLAIGQLLVAPLLMPAAAQVAQDVPTLAPMIAKVAPAVVNISVQGRVAEAQNPLLNDPFFRRFFDIPNQPPERQFQAAGSGVIVDAENGYVLTNNHVVENADRITVSLMDDRQLDATVVGTDPEADIAVIKIPADRLTALPIGDSDELRVGDYVVAIGNPFGLSQTVTSGIVSAVGRTGLGIEGYEDFIQTDASINPGNSGGALVDLRGRLIGINTAIVGPGGGSVGIGFAIPINMARSIKDQLIKHGQVRRGMLGVLVQDLTPEIAKALKIDRQGGAVIAKVESGSPADGAGLKAGDVIVGVDGQDVHDGADLRNRIGLKDVGDRVMLQFVRDGRSMSVTTTLAARERERVAGADLDERLAGTVFGIVQEGGRRDLRPGGIEVLSVDPRSAAYRDGLREGDVITSVNRQAVSTLSDFQSAVRASGGAILFNLVRGDAALFVVIQ